mmetsp:Transcript_15628/g.34158  ORF Transcript_15628/g.34158 Transcript_15628/m.34158 type:complete len:207 (-) Transcript_15628:3149-3769(-)
MTRRIQTILMMTARFYMGEYTPVLAPRTNNHPVALISSRNEGGNCPKRCGTQCPKSKKFFRTENRVLFRIYLLVRCQPNNQFLLQHRRICTLQILVSEGRLFVIRISGEIFRLGPRQAKWTILNTRGLRKFSKSNGPLLRPLRMMSWNEAEETPQHPWKRSRICWRNQWAYQPILPKNLRQRRCTQQRKHDRAYQLGTSTRWTTMM